MRSLFRLIGILLVLAFIYFLSIGPAVLLEERSIISKSSFEVVYSPLEKVAKKMPTAENALKAYVGFWKSVDHRK